MKVSLDDVDKKVQDFGDLLDTIENVDSKKKKLWKEIYENAILDRSNAYDMYLTLISIAKDLSTEHAVHGKTIATYIEKMSRANDQLIRLAELITRAESSDDEPIDPEMIYAQLKK